MKQLLLITSLFFTISVFGQTNSSCKVIQFLHKDSIASESKLTAVYHPRGFYLVKNGVYDFVIGGKKYFQSILLNVNEDTFSISTKWETKENTEQIFDTLNFSINQDIQIRMLSIHNRVGGIPTTTKLKDYVVSIKESSEYCELKYNEIVIKNVKYLGHYYFTQIGFKTIKMIKGKPYLCEKRGDYLMWANGRVDYVEQDGAYVLRRK